VKIFLSCTFSFHALLFILADMSPISPVKFEEMNSDMEENTELADNRFVELQKLQQDLQSVHQENNNMKVDVCFTTFFWLSFGKGHID